jgi:glyoxylase-like metal-dependent hydrolase (beta-lactamase superfamily II)
MKLTQRIVADCYRIPLGFVNAFVIARPDELTLVDCGMPGSADRIEKALNSIGCSLRALKHILITHCHPDHAGSLAELQRRCPNAKTYMHAEDAAMVRAGIAVPAERPLRPAPGLHNYLMFHGFVGRISPKIEAARVDSLVYEGQRLPIAGGITVIHAPGHSAGQVCFLWHADHGVLFAGDVASCVFGPTYSIAYEDFELGKQTLCELVTHPFEYACFGHGKTIMRTANRRLSKAFNPGISGRLVPATDGLMRDVAETVQRSAVSNSGLVERKISAISRRSSSVKCSKPESASSEVRIATIR